MNLETKKLITTRKNIAKSFGSASNSYDVSARLQRFSGKNLMPWLPKNKDLTVVDLGCGTGFFTDLLSSNYDTVIGFDISSSMLNYAKKKRASSIHWLEGDAHKLPFQDNSIDVIYSNLVIQWCDPLNVAITEILRVLKPGGCFIFTTLIDGTLYELKSSWSEVDNDKHVIDFKQSTDLRSLFNTSISTVAEETCQDVVLEYENVLHLARELKGLGANHVPSQRNKGLAGKDKWFKMIDAYQSFKEESGIYPATYSVFSAKVMKTNV